MPAVSPLFLLPNTSTVLARSAISILKSADQAVLDEAIQTLLNKNLAAAAVMPLLEQSVNFSEVLEKLAEDWSDATLRAFATAFSMDVAKRNVMDVIVAIAILNEPDLESELRSENTDVPTANDLLENRKVTWQYPPPGTVLTPPYVVLVAVEAIDTTQADSEIQSILGELVDYRGYKIARRASTGGPLRRPDLTKFGAASLLKNQLLATSVLSTAAATTPDATQPVQTAAPPPVDQGIAAQALAAAQAAAAQAAAAQAAAQAAAAPATTAAMGAVNAVRRTMALAGVAQSSRAILGL